MGQHVTVSVDGAPKEVSQGVVIVQEDQEETMVVISHFGDQLLMSLENWRKLIDLYLKAELEFNAEN